MVTLLAGLAEFERELIVARTSEGRACANARGVEPGPRFMLSAEQRAYVARERAKGESVRHLARMMGPREANQEQRRQRQSNPRMLHCGFLIYSGFV